MKNKIHIITYADSLGENLNELDLVLEKYFRDIVGGVHILPFYPSSGDRGFAPVTHLEVDSKFGNWEDIQKLSKKYIVTADIMVNHISTKSFFFRDYLEKGDESKYADYFVTSDKFSRRILPCRKKSLIILNFIEKIINNFRNFDKIFHTTGVNKFSFKKIYRPRSESPFIPFVFKDGTIKHFWCTFTKEQVDLDFCNEEVKNFLKEYIIKLAQNGIKIIRLDAVGYTIKKRGTNSFMLPETYDLIDWLSKVAHENGMLSLPEIHNHYDYQVELSNMKEVDFVYDFQIPLLILNAIYNKDVTTIKKWLKIRPENTINVLDTHDGIPIVDVKDLLAKSEIAETSKKIILNGGNEAKRASGNNEVSNVDTYQINCTYYSALRENDDDYIVARAIQFFIPGISQVYYVGLLAGKNDVDKLRETNIGRDINRHNYTIKEIENEMERIIVKRLMRLMKFRNEYPVFDGKFTVEKSSNKKLIFKWFKEKLFFEVIIDLEKKKVKAYFVDEKSGKEKTIEF